MYVVGTVSNKSKASSKRLDLPASGWVVAAVMFVIVILLWYGAVRTDQAVKTRVNEGGQAWPNASDLERVAGDLELKLQAADRELARLNEALDQARAEIDRRDERIAMLSQGIAPCNEFFEEEDVVKTSAPSISAIFMIAREAAAAKDCLAKGDVATACKHWQGLLLKIAKMGPPVRDSGVEIEDLMRQNHCQNPVSSAPARPLRLELNLGP